MSKVIERIVARLAKPCHVCGRPRGTSKGRFCQSCDRLLSAVASQMDNSPVGSLIALKNLRYEAEPRIIARTIARIKQEKIHV